MLQPDKTAQEDGLETRGHGSRGQRRLLDGTSIPVLGLIQRPGMRRGTQGSCKRGRGAIDWSLQGRVNY